MEKTYAFFWILHPNQHIWCSCNLSEQKHVDFLQSEQFRAIFVRCTVQAVKPITVFRRSRRPGGALWTTPRHLDGDTRWPWQMLKLEIILWRFIWRFITLHEIHNNSKWRVFTIHMVCFIHERMSTLRETWKGARLMRTCCCSVHSELVGTLMFNGICRQGPWIRYAQWVVWCRRTCRQD